MNVGRGVLHQAAEGERLEARGSVMLFKAVSAATGGRLSVMERSLPAGGRLPPVHAHPDRAEFFYVLAGVITFLIDGHQRAGESGCSVVVPRDGPHTFGNTGPEEARLLVVHSPGLDDYFRELQTLWSGPTPPTVAAERELMARQGMRSG